MPIGGAAAHGRAVLRSLKSYRVLGHQRPQFRSARSSPIQAALDQQAVASHSATSAAHASHQQYKRRGAPHPCQIQLRRCHRSHEGKPQLRPCSWEENELKASSRTKSLNEKHYKRAEDPTRRPILLSPIRAASSASAFELLTRFDTGQLVVIRRTLRTVMLAAIPGDFRYKRNSQVWW
jgi:hypothetical protein